MANCAPGLCRNVFRRANSGPDLFPHHLSSAQTIPKITLAILSLMEPGQLCQYSFAIQYNCVPLELRQTERLCPRVDESSLHQLLPLSASAKYRPFLARAIDGRDS